MRNFKYQAIHIQSLLNTPPPPTPPLVNYLTSKLVLVQLLYLALFGIREYLLVRLDVN